LRDRDLVRLYCPVELRPAFDALFAIEDALADVVAQSTQPALGAIKLAWWRERLEELDKGKIPAEPRLQAAAAELLPRGVTGVELAPVEHGWSALLDENPDVSAFADHGARLFSLGAKLLDAKGGMIAQAGRAYARAEAMRRGLAKGRAKSEIIAGIADRKLRPLTGLAVLAVRDLQAAGGALEHEGTPGRAWALLRHRLTGRFPR
jgi:phytoene synthase